MSDQFDDRLRHRIQNVFGDYHEEPNPAQWQELKKRLQKKKRRTAIIWFKPGLRVAAALIPFALLLWFLQSSSDITVPQETSKRLEPQNNSVPLDDSLDQPLLSNKTLDSAFAKPKQALTQGQANRESTDTINPLAKTDSANNQILDAKENPLFANALDPTDAPKQEGISIASDSKAQEWRLIQKIKSQDIIQKAEYFALDLNLKVEDLLKSNANSGDSLPSIYDLPNQFAKTNRKKREKVAWGLALSPNYTFAQEESTSLNLGGGLSSEIPLSKHWVLFSGLSIARQRFDLNPMGGEASAANTSVFAENSRTSRNLNATNVDLISLDVPINIRYNLDWQKSKGLSISMGISSLAYLRENYTNNFTETRLVPTFADEPAAEFGPVSFETEVAEVQEQDNNAAFQTLEWAGLLNLSVGLRYPVFKTMSMEIEPFIKYPLRRFTEQELRLGSGGINMRLILGR